MFDLFGTQPKIGDQIIYPDFDMDGECILVSFKKRVRKLDTFLKALVIILGCHILWIWFGGQKYYYEGNYLPTF